MDRYGACMIIVLMFQVTVVLSTTASVNSDESVKTKYSHEEVVEMATEATHYMPMAYGFPEKYDFKSLVGYNESKEGRLLVVEVEATKMKFDDEYGSNKKIPIRCVMSCEVIVQWRVVVRIQGSCVEENSSPIDLDTLEKLRSTATPMRHFQVMPQLFID